MTIACRRCTHDDDFAKVSLFWLANKHDVHRSFVTLDIVSLLCSYATQGHLLYIADDESRVVAILAYYHGTPEKEFQDKEIVRVDIAILERAYRGTRFFLKGFRSIVDQIMEAHPDAQEFQFVAFSENAYLCRLYSKFAAVSYTRNGELGEETVFCVKIHHLKATLYDLYKV